MWSQRTGTAVPPRRRTLGRPRTISDEAILAALARAISRVGPARLTLADVAAEAGVAAPTIMQFVEASDNAALLLRGVRRQQARRGQVAAAPGSAAAHWRFEAGVYLLPAAEGGRRTAVRTGYRPQFFVRTADVMGVLDLGPDGVAAPGARVTATVELGQSVALEAGLGFAIREGGRTVGAGTVTRLLD